MNQTKKRLSIINHAISITDVETIQLQVLKLAPLTSDVKIQEIVTAIQAENYARAQGLINQYIEMPTENILQRTSQKAQATMAEEDQAIIDEFDLFITSNTNEKPQEIDINDFLCDELPKPMETKHVDQREYEALLNIDVDNVLPDNIELDTADITSDNFFESSHETTKQPIDTGTIPRDTFFDTDQTVKEEKNEKNIQVNRTEDLQQKSAHIEDREYKELLNIDIDSVLPDNIELDAADTTSDTFFNTDQTVKEEKYEKTIQEKIQKDFTEYALNEEIPVEEDEVIITDDIPSKDDLLKALKPITRTEEKSNRSHYKEIPYIAQKLISMKKQYPAIEETHEKFDSVENLLTKISQKGYTEKEIEETLAYIKQLTEEGKVNEAAQLLLVCAATESKFAQFMLARELYKGILLRKDVPEAFEQMHSLTLEDYPEALCDIAQFYEHGIGISKNKKKAAQFYKEAMDFGIKRAEKHYDRLKNQNRGFFKR